MGRPGEPRDGAGRAEEGQLRLALGLRDGRLWGREVARCVQERKPAVGSLRWKPVSLRFCFSRTTFRLA